ncbi:hypothetical protein WICPIJ_004184 [Wickerhamomyces pijperi]|uniref:Membrane insertase YidC/Oxa/ALB C-terminal domain-containing protein n=1 Tax=Wickerhamomyces pijperi TaxID=599730 RepID=A0A9P8TNI0_WICPI|nr:hypothetical protein WICPIJ_004184 [Wickerhamomyces pijperi]
MLITRLSCRNFALQRQAKRTFVTETLSVLTSSVQSVHAFTGLPWWAVIPLTTITLRSLWTLPLAIFQRQRIQKQSSLRPIVNAMGPILRLKLAAKAQASREKESQRGNSGGLKGAAATLNYEQIMLLSAKERRNRQKELFKAHGCQAYKNFILPAFQIPLWVALSATFRELSGSFDTSVTSNMDLSLTDQGALWFTDLTLADPLHILPVVLGGLVLTNVEWNFKTFQLQSFGVKRSQRITMIDSMINISRLSVVFFMAVASQAPSALVLYWISSNVFSIIQNIFLDAYFPTRYTPYTRDSTKLTDSDKCSLVK